MYGLTRFKANNNSHDPFTELTRGVFGYDPFTAHRRPVQAPRFDFIESRESYSLQGDLPGVTEEDIEITVHEGVLTVSGSRNEEVSSEEATFLVRERRAGEFSRSLRLPKDADVDKVEARFDNGVLNISIAKKEELQARKIKIQ